MRTGLLTLNNQTLGFAHGALDVHIPEVLPVFLEQGHQEFDSQVDVVDQLIISHLHVTNGNSQTQHLLHLELDGDVTLSTLATMFSLCVSREKNLATFFRPGPRICRICLIRDKKASHFLASFLTIFLFLLSFLSTRCPCGGDPQSQLRHSAAGPPGCTPRTWGEGWT